MDLQGPFLLVALVVSGLILGAVAGVVVVEGLEQVAIGESPDDSWSKSGLGLAQLGVLAVLVLAAAVASGRSFWQHRLQAGAFLAALMISLPVGLVFA